MVAVHSAFCAECRDFILQLAAGADSIIEWGGRASIVVSDSLNHAIELHKSISGVFQVLADPDGNSKLEPPALIIADEWGEIYFMTEPGREHAFPTRNEIVEWVRFIAIQCPECEQPEGAWRTI
jgi:hypothetical protein